MKLLEKLSETLSMLCCRTERDGFLRRKDGGLKFWWQLQLSFLSNHLDPADNQPINTSPPTHTLGAVPERR
jgi:hypothetical protein